MKPIKEVIDVVARVLDVVAQESHVANTNRESIKIDQY